MKVPEQALALARRFEGLRFKPYLCPAGVATVGYGATRYPDGRRVRLDDPPVTRVAAEFMLSDEMAHCVAASIRLCPVLINEPASRLAAIADFCFNLGAGRLQTSTLRRRVNQRDWPEAVYEIKRWNKGGGRVLRGLVIRRDAEAALLA